MPPLSRDAKNLIRDALALPERERVEMLNAVAKDLAAGGALAPEVAKGEEMRNAMEIFNNVADHLGYDSDIAKLLMKMREFDSAPARVREGVKARQIARVFFNSWDTAKAAAVGEDLPVTPAQEKQRRLVGRERRRNRRIEEGLEQWLATDPERTSVSAYNQWRKEQNAQLSDGEPKFLAPTSIITYWDRSWPEIIAEAQAGTLKPPRIQAGDPLAAERTEEAEATGTELDFESGEPGKVEFDPSLIARRLRQARTARGMTKSELSARSTLSKTAIERLEDGRQGDRIQFSSIIRLARALTVPVDFFVTDDGKTGLPPRQGIAQAKKRLKTHAPRG